MAGGYDSGVQPPQLLNGLDKFADVGKIVPIEGTKGGQIHIGCKKEIRFRNVKRQMPRCVPGGVDGLETDATEIQAFLINQIMTDFDLEHAIRIVQVFCQIQPASLQADRIKKKIAII